MKKVLKALGKALKEFFISLKNDIIESFKKHWLKVIGLIISIVFPAVYLMVTYIEKKPESWAIPAFVWLPVLVFIFVYWFKLRTYLAIKCESMTRENIAEKGKHAGAIIVLKTLQVAMVITPFVICYFIFKSFADLSIKIENIFLLLTICEAVGGVFIIVDTVVNVVKIEEEKKDSK